MLKIFSNISNKTKAIYLTWIMVNLLLLLVNNSIKDIFFGGNDDFFPFHGLNYLSLYDTSEFLAYTILPVMIYAIIKMYRQK